MPAFGAAQPLRHETPRDRAATSADLLGSASGAARPRRRLRAEAVRRRAAPQAGLNRPDLGRHDDGKSVAALSSSFERASATVPFAGRAPIIRPLSRSARLILSLKFWRCLPSRRRPRRAGAVPAIFAGGRGASHDRRGAPKYRRSAPPPVGRGAAVVNGTRSGCSCPPPRPRPDSRRSAAGSSGRRA